MNLRRFFCSASLIMMGLYSVSVMAGTWNNNSRWNEHRNFSAKSIISTGSEFSLVINRGKVWGWGNNSTGQLGNDPSFTPSTNFPVEMRTNFRDEVIMVAAGGKHSLILWQDGVVGGTGSDFYGQLGLGTPGSYKTFVQAVNSIDSIVAIAAGGSHSLALSVTGQVYSWGLNSSGQLGLGSTLNHNTPQVVTGLSNVVAISAGNEYSMALLADGTVWAWGKNSEGQLGDNSTTTRLSPVQVSGLSNVVSISAGDSAAYAVLANGSAYSWGSNDNGQLGNNSTTQSTTPVQITSLSNVEYIQGGGSHATARLADGSMWSWGNNSNGQLGNASTSQSLVPVEITSLGSIFTMSSGGTHGLALRADGEILCWGNNTMGQVGDSTNTQRTSPTLAKGSNIDLAGVIQATAGSEGHSVVIRPNGEVYSWGNNNFGQLGHSAASDSTQSAGLVTGLSNVMKVSAGQNFTLALKADGTVWAWGRNSAGQLGQGSTNTSKNATPLQISALSNIIDVVAGPDFAMALEANGTLWVWGQDVFGIQGDGGPTGVIISTPHNIASINNVIGMSLGQYHVSVLKSDGTCWSWGRNTAFASNAANGMLGDGTMIDSKTPVQVTGCINTVDVAAGSYFSMALDASGNVAGWGSSWFGEFGAGTSNTEYLSPQPALISRIKRINGGDRFAKFLTANGILYSSGLNSSGVLGDGTLNSFTSPLENYLLDTFSVAEGFVSTDNGGNHGTTIRYDWNVCVVGENGKGQLGNQTSVDSWVYICNSDINCEPGTEPTVATITPVDTVKCAEGASATLVGNTAIVGTGRWNVLQGNATVSPPTNAFAAASNLSRGINRFEWTISTESCPANRDTIDVVVYDMNGADSAAAGNDVEICITDCTTPAGANAPISMEGTGTWAVVSGNSVSMVSPNSESSVICPTGNAGVTLLSWKKTEGPSSANCTSTDYLLVTVYDTPTPAIIATTGDSLCAYGTAELDANTPSVGSGLWSAKPPYGNNSDFVGSRSQPSIDYSPLVEGTNVFYWTISNGPCPVTEDSVMFEVKANPLTPDAGGDQALCETGTVCMNGNNPFSNTAVWSVVNCPTDSINDTTSQTACISNLCPGINYAVWTFSNGFCVRSDTAVITVYEQPSTAIANYCALKDTICATDTVDLCANVPTSGTGTWTMLAGVGTVDNQDSANTYYFPGTFNVNTPIEWKICSGLCGCSKDTLNLFIEAAPNTAKAGFDKTMRCYEINNCFVGNDPGDNGQTGCWTHEFGTAVFDPTDGCLDSACLTGGLQPDTNWFYYTTSSVFGTCTSVDSMRINYDPVVQMTLDIADNSGCIFLTGGNRKAGTIRFVHIDYNGDTVSYAADSIYCDPSTRDDCGYYYATAETPEGCLLISDTIEWVDEDGYCYCCVGIEEDLLSKVGIQPNPTKDVVTLTLSSDLPPVVKMTVYNGLGEIISEGNIIGYRHELDLAPYESGIYFVRLSTGSAEITRRIIKME